MDIMKLTEARMPNTVLSITEKMADTAAAGSVAFASAAWITDAEPYLAVGAALVAIVAGALSAWYHFERAVFMHARRMSDAQAHKKNSAKED